MAVGDTVSQWFADILNTDVTEGGYIAGAIFMAALLAIGLVFASRSKGGMLGLVVIVFFGAIVAWFLGWFPPVIPMLFAGALFAVGVFSFRGAAASE